MAELIIRENEMTRKVPLQEGGEVIIGRSKDCGVSFPKDPKISGKHCRIYFFPEKNAFALGDLNSTNGTTLNHNRISTDILLSDNDKIKIGDVRILYRDSTFASPTSTKKVLKLANRKQPEEEFDKTDTCVFPNMASIIRKPKITIVDNFELKSGATVGDYAVSRKIADFRYGAIYAATKANSTESFALKIYNNAFDVHHSAIDEFYNMMGLLSRIDNPYFVNIVDYMTHQGHCCYTMKFVEAGDLNLRIAESAPLPEYDALCIMYTIGAALDFICSEFKVIHGDLAPASIMIDDENNLVINSYGMTEWLMKHISGGAPLPSPYYISPEHVKGDAIDWYSDMYSLGVILFQLLTAQLPFNANTTEELHELHLRQELPAPRKVNPNIWISEETRILLLKMTAKDPAERFSSWGECLEVAEHIYEELVEAEGEEEEEEEAEVEEEEELTKEERLRREVQSEIQKIKTDTKKLKTNTRRIIRPDQLSE